MSAEELTYKPYDSKNLIVFGDRKKYQKQINLIGGRWNSKKNGWLLPLTNQGKLEHFISNPHTKKYNRQEEKEKDDDNSDDSDSSEDSDRSEDELPPKVEEHPKIDFEVPRTTKSSKVENFLYKVHDEVETPKPKSEVETPKPKSERTEYPKSERTEYPKSERTEYPKSERTEYPKSERTEYTYPKSERTEYPKSERPEYTYPKSERTEYPKSERTEYPKSERPEPEFKIVSDKNNDKYLEYKRREEENRLREYRRREELKKREELNNAKHKYVKQDPKVYDRTFKEENPYECYKLFNKKPINFRKEHNLTDSDSEDGSDVESDSSHYDDSSSDGFPSPSTPKKQQYHNEKSYNELYTKIRDLNKRLTNLEGNATKRR